ncbi:arginine--tRNA ligase [Candidatus Nomurabacteria bacterium RIFCSPLOWO2_02_40_28]|uniref:Arginine--tRNA ligase n=2 Tax=Candidatus Nomuraibacteriota TaxID=1752729 RepID=A0A837HUG8_9BACT|nr:MAG: Arginine-tRNA ligase [Candidatus Nomurabacteria bacterium GW2011_GWC2_39_41]KKR36907.1 MAG: Arginine-tRNA ligase [Candidatus Nomurabacteria bacterium GW2011_GWE2_40_10]KKR38520.1 MAG: Arginine-tRNA ligase [Candidatus Nomurabacteria bacterium GW2011_GWB1_40_11]KKR39669.1 MAG: Arginine-tRNA ligase [Parcubacteria group bacterium GW2011_GWC1_40_11]KKR59646.1 MAG: Arginine-tRNA ligase [Candidatus Nomurabacteria bacterium GW2011_GWF2_40_31]KKR66738.1 MAG: Arginine-tRNA ligase [Parcubacteria 
MQEKIRNLIGEALESLNIGGVAFVVEHPEDLKNGDYSTNVAMACAKNLKTNPKELAEKIVAEMSKAAFDNLEKIEVAGAGFINFHLSRKFFAKSVEEILNQGEDVGKNNSLQGKKIMVEYTDPNPFKPFHIGHLMTNAIGESIARILEHSGAAVSRANYQGDVGLHVAKAIWGLLKNPELADQSIVSNAAEATNIGKAYVAGATAYESDEKIKKEIDEVNKKIYDRSDKKINELYDWGFRVTMDAFEDLYKILGTKFDYYFVESIMAPIGERVVKDNLDKIIDSRDSKMIFEKSDDAIVFKAEKYDPKLHTRVFITSGGIPTYEAKELGLALEKFRTEPNLDLSVVITANEQADYMKVVAKALSLIHPEYENKMLHITHGMMRLATGKMSSRKGNVVTGESLIRDTVELVHQRLEARDWDHEIKEKVASIVGVAALKYSILKQSTGGDIMYDFDKSISFEGDSGPYLQYSYARANSVLEKAKKENIFPDPHAFGMEISEVEKLLYRFPEVVSRSASEYEPHYIASYLIEVARAFNSFYGNTVIVDTKDKTSSYKIALTFAFSFVIKNGLQLLGIQVPEKM